MATLEPVHPSQSYSGAQEYSFAQPLWQFILLSVLTFGLYNLYWFYRNWLHIKRYKHLDINPLGRTLLLFLPFYNLYLAYRQLRYIREMAQEANSPAAYSPALVLAAYVGMIILGRLGGAFGFLALLSVLPLVLVQETLNGLWRQVQADLPERTRLLVREAVLAALGALVWLATLAAPMLPLLSSPLSALSAQFPGLTILTGVPASQYQVANQRKIAFNRVISLSPDGRSVFVQFKDELIVADYDAGPIKQQIAFKPGIDPGSLAWSPDSKRIAFHEYGALLLDPDLWVLDIETGKLANLTEDGLQTIDLRPTAPNPLAVLDQYPAWSPDGKELAFVRRTQSADRKREQAVYRINAAGGEPTKVVTILDDLIASYGTRWSRNGKEIYYSLSAGPQGNPNGGVWSVTPDGQTVKQLVKAAGPGTLKSPSVLAISADGRALVIYNEPPVITAFPNNLSRIFVVDLKTGAATPLKSTENVTGPLEFTSPTAATFSPDGRKLLYTYQDGRRIARLVVRDIDGREEILLLEQSKETGLLTFGLTNSRLHWADNNRVLVGTSGTTGLVLDLSTK